MKALRWLGIGLLSMTAIVLCIGIATRFSGGPLGPFPGGPLVDGVLQDAPDRPAEDWAFVDPIDAIEFQLVEPPRSRTVWILYHAGDAYIPCGIPNFRLWKQWPHEALIDGRAVVRIEGTRYRVDVTRVEDVDVRAALADGLAAKYDVSADYSSEVWFFKLVAPVKG
jgi:hypothetical protein